MDLYLVISSILFAGIALYFTMNGVRAPNKLTIGLLVLQPILWLACGLPLADLKFQIGAALFMFIVGLIAFGIGKSPVPPGVLKFAVVVVLWVPFESILYYVVYLAAISLALSFAVSIHNGIFKDKRTDSINIIACMALALSILAWDKDQSFMSLMEPSYTQDAKSDAAKASPDIPSLRR